MKTRKQAQRRSYHGIWLYGFYKQLKTPSRTTLSSPGFWHERVHPEKGCPFRSGCNGLEPLHHEHYRGFHWRAA